MIQCFGYASKIFDAKDGRAVPIEQILIPLSEIHSDILVDRYDVRLLVAESYNNLLALSDTYDIVHNGNDNTTIGSTICGKTTGNTSENSFEMELNAERYQDLDICVETTATVPVVTWRDRLRSLSNLEENDIIPLAELNDPIPSNIVCDGNAEDGSTVTDNKDHQTEGGILFAPPPEYSMKTEELPNLVYNFSSADKPLSCIPMAFATASAKQKISSWAATVRQHLIIEHTANFIREVGSQAEFRLRLLEGVENQFPFIFEGHELHNYYEALKQTEYVLFDEAPSVVPPALHSFYGVTPFEDSAACNADDTAAQKHIEVVPRRKRRRFVQVLSSDELDSGDGVIFSDELDSDDETVLRNGSSDEAVSVIGSSGSLSDNSINDFSDSSSDSSSDNSKHISSDGSRSFVQSGEAAAAGHNYAAASSKRTKMKSSKVPGSSWVDKDVIDIGTNEQESISCTNDRQARVDQRLEEHNSEAVVGGLVENKNNRRDVATEFEKDVADGFSPVERRQQKEIDVKIETVAEVKTDTVTVDSATECITGTNLSNLIILDEFSSSRIDYCDNQAQLSIHASSSDETDKSGESVQILTPEAASSVEKINQHDIQCLDTYTYTEPLQGSTSVKKEVNSSVFLNESSILLDLSCRPFADAVDDGMSSIDQCGDVPDNLERENERSPTTSNMASVGSAVWSDLLGHFYDDEINDSDSKVIDIPLTGESSARSSKTITDTSTYESGLDISSIRQNTTRHASTTDDAKSLFKSLTTRSTTLISDVTPTKGSSIASIQGSLTKPLSILVNAAPCVDDDQSTARSKPLISTVKNLGVVYVKNLARSIAPAICWKPPTAELCINEESSRVIQEIGYELLRQIDDDDLITTCTTLSAESSPFDFLRPSKMEHKYFMYVMHKVADFRKKERADGKLTNLSPLPDNTLHENTKTFLCGLHELTAVLQISSLTSALRPESHSSVNRKSTKASAETKGSRKRKSSNSSHVLPESCNLAAASMTIADSLARSRVEMRGSASTGSDGCRNGNASDNVVSSGSTSLAQSTPFMSLMGQSSRSVSGTSNLSRVTKRDMGRVESKSLGFMKRSRLSSSEESVKLPSDQGDTALQDIRRRRVKDILKSKLSC